MLQHTTYSNSYVRQQLWGTFEKANRTITVFPADLINVKPAENAWSAINVADHLTKSNQSISKALVLHGSKINRDAGERVPELESIFLDFTRKFDAPSFILPGVEPIEKQDAIKAFTLSCDEIIRLANEVDLSEMINHKAFGDITKFEILHFVIYHTIRHTVQLENIYSTIINNNNK